jgi:uncharacterized protein DUF6600
MARGVHTFYYSLPGSRPKTPFGFIKRDGRPHRRHGFQERIRFMRKHTVNLVGLLALLFSALLFVPQRAAADDDDPPTQVARLSFVEGSVSFEPAGAEDWVTAVINRPMTTGDKLWVDRDSRAELRLGAASIRLGANTGFSFLNLDDRTVQLQLTEGTLRIRVKRLDRDEVFEVDTPNLAFNVSRPGIYRINVNEAGDTTAIVVRDGEGQVTGGGESYMVHADETGIFTGTDQLSADMEGVGSDDDLERWSYERDRREDHSASRRYVSDDAVGYEDLDEYGGWRDVPEYGTIWFPHTTVSGWAPYRYGHWVWISPWGYTWVDDEPWGFAPFHYGRWVYVGNAWGWVPCRPAAVVGVAYVRPVYAPALVAWVGGSGFAVGVGIGGGESVGWFPLGPREVYVPSYRVSRTYVNNVNVTNTTVNTTVVNNYYNNVVVNKNVTVNNVTYVNQRVAGAVTATSRQVMTTSQPVSRNIVRVDERRIASAPVEARTPSIPPERQAFVGAGRPAARPPEQVMARSVVAKTAPPPPPASVERQQALVRQNGGQPASRSQIRQAEPQQARAAAPVKVAGPTRPAPVQQNTGNRQPVPQNVNRPVQQPPNTQQNNNAPQNANRPATAPPNNARPGNERTDRPPAAQPANPSERPNTAPNAQPNRPPANQQAQPNRPPENRPANQHSNPPANERNDRPPSARPTNPPPQGNPQLERQHQQELENMRRQQDQERQRVEQQQAQERQRADQQRADAQRQQQMQQQHQQQLQEMEKKHDQEQQRVQQRQEQEHQQQRAEPPPRQQERPQPPPRQQERPKQDKDKPKEKDKPPKA